MYYLVHSENNCAHQHAQFSCSWSAPLFSHIYAKASFLMTGLICFFSIFILHLGPATEAESNFTISKEIFYIFPSIQFFFIYHRCKNYLTILSFWFWGLVGWLILNVPVNNFSVMLGRSHRFLGITSTFWGVNVPCSRTQHGLTRVRLEPLTSGSGVQGINHQATELPSVLREPLPKLITGRSKLSNES